MPRKIDAGELLAAAGGLLVFVALFLDWFGGLTGWESFEALDLVIAVLALVAVAAAASSLAGADPGPSSRALPWVGAVLLAIVAVQLIDPPPMVEGVYIDRGGGDVVLARTGGADLGTGAWLGLAGALLVLLGGLLRSASVSVTVSVGGRDTRRRVPAVDRRPPSSASGASGAASSDPAASSSAGAGPAAPRAAGADPGPGGAAHAAGETAPGDTQPTQPFSALEDR